MKYLSWIAAFCGFCGAVLAQPFIIGTDSIFAPSQSASVPFSPTNIQGFPALTWYVASDYATNAGKVSLPDRCSHGYNLTNLGGANTFPTKTAGGLNGLDYISFDGAGTYLKCVNYTSPQPHEVVMVMSFTNKNTFPQIFDGTTSVNEHSLLQFPLGTWDIRTGGGNTAAANIISNKWMLIDVVFNGTASTIYTNGIAGVTVDAGTYPMSGLTLGVGYGLSGTTYSDYSCAELATYSGLLPGTNATARSTLTSYFTNKYNIAP